MPSEIWILSLPFSFPFPFPCFNFLSNASFSAFGGISFYFKGLCLVIRLAFKWGLFGFHRNGDNFDFEKHFSNQLVSFPVPKGSPIWTFKITHFHKQMKLGILQDGTNLHVWNWSQVIKCHNRQSFVTKYTGLDEGDGWSLCPEPISANWRTIKIGIYKWVFNVWSFTE